MWTVSFQSHLSQMKKHRLCALLEKHCQKNLRPYNLVHISLYMTQRSFQLVVRSDLVQV